MATLISAQGISFFHGTWQEALDEAKKTDKVVFVDAYAKWCGPCKAMARNVFTQEEVGNYFNENFINLKLDMEEKDGISFGRKYPVSAFPTLFFLTPDGEMIKKSVGGKKAKDLIELGKNSLKGYDKSGQYVDQYEAGNRDFDLMLNYVSALNKVGKPSLKISNDYISSNPNISDDQKAKFLLAAITESDSKLFEELMPLKKKAKKHATEEEYEKKIETACMKTVAKAVEYEFEELLTEAIEKYKEADAGDHKKFAFEAKLHYNALMSNYEPWVDLSKSYLKKYGKKNPAIYKEQLSSLKKNFNYVDESTEYATTLAKGLIKYEDTTPNYMLYIQMLLSCDKGKEAIKVTKEAIKKASKRDENTKQLEQYLDYIQKEQLD
ncbi:MAG: DUF255 domain-containing protein [Saprospiraceae bacterium]|nr:DUF255 domain-containing protein [Saprospiraceae bacterium]NNL93720.1 DUF255 domain-containing protein [Saprospiraceae bacterium]